MEQKEVSKEFIEEKLMDTSFWENLIYKLDETDTKIIMQLYYPKQQPFIFDLFYKRLKTVHLSYSGLRKKIARLEKFRLITIVKKTRPLCIYPTININETLLDRLIELLCQRHGLKNIKFGGSI